MAANHFCCEKKSRRHVKYLCDLKRQDCLVWTGQVIQQFNGIEMFYNTIFAVATMAASEHILLVCFPLRLFEFETAVLKGQKRQQVSCQRNHVRKHAGHQATREIFLLSSNFMQKSTLQNCMGA